MSKTQVEVIAALRIELDATKAALAKAVAERDAERELVTRLGHARQLDATLIHSAEERAEKAERDLGNFFENLDINSLNKALTDTRRERDSLRERLGDAERVIEAAQKLLNAMNYIEGSRAHDLELAITTFESWRKGRWAMSDCYACGGFNGKHGIGCTVEALAASQARVAELERDVELHRRNGEIQFARAEKTEAESAAKDAALNAMREALEKELNLEETAAASTARMRAALSLEAVKLAADAQARRDEAVASLGDLLEVLADMDRETHLQKLKWDDRARLRERASAALAKVKP